VPLHIHVAEQTREVDECSATTGLRPIEWLSRHAELDSRWQLIHATHASAEEIRCVARSGAGIVICPSTEANLGDGLSDLPGWLNAAVPIALGSDSQVTRNWPEELRWLEYGQRLMLRRRNVAASPDAAEPSTAARLFNLALGAGTRAAGQARWGLEVGARADALVLDHHAPGVLGMPAGQMLDALIFASDAAAIGTVYVAGHVVVERGRHRAAPQIAARFKDAMAELWSEA
jgi:formimidoylglutamate deiminase